MDFGWVHFGKDVRPWLQRPAPWGLVELLNAVCLEYNMAVIFGVPLLAPLGMMLNGQNVGGGGGGTAASSECVRTKELPQIRSEMGW